MPQNRRTHQLMMKHRASSLSALAHNGVNIDNSEEGGGNPNTARSGKGRPESLNDEVGRCSTDSSAFSKCGSLSAAGGRSGSEDGEVEGSRTSRLSCLVEDENFEPEEKDEDFGSTSVVGVNPGKLNRTFEGEENETKKEGSKDSSQKLETSKVAENESVEGDTSKVEENTSNGQLKCAEESDGSLNPKDTEKSDESKGKQSDDVSNIEISEADELVHFRDTSAKNKLYPIQNDETRQTSSLAIETIETVSFDDIDDALFFKPSKSILFESNPLDTPTEKPVKSPKKKVTMDESSFRHSPPKSTLARFRKTITSFRRPRYKTDGDLAYCHPDEKPFKISTSFCVIL